MDPELIDDLIAIDIDPAVELDLDEADSEALVRYAAEASQLQDGLGNLFKPLIPRLKQADKVKAIKIGKALQGRRAALSRRLAAFRGRSDKRRKAAAMCRAPVFGGTKPISREEIRGKAQLSIPLFADIIFKAGPLSDSIQGFAGASANVVKLFHKGIDDAGSVYGRANPIDRHTTNLITAGKLADGHIFVGHGVEFLPRTLDGGEMDPADLRVLGDFLVRWSGRNNSSPVPLGHMRDMPASRGFVVAANGGNNALGVRFSGRPMYGKDPFMVLRGGDTGQEMQLDVADASQALTNAVKLTVRITGRYYHPATGVAL